MEPNQPTQQSDKGFKSRGELIAGIVVLVVAIVGYGFAAKTNNWWPHQMSQGRPYGMTATTSFFPVPAVSESAASVAHFELVLSNGTTEQSLFSFEGPDNYLYYVPSNFYDDRALLGLFQKTKESNIAQVDVRTKKVSYINLPSNDSFLEDVVQADVGIFYTVGCSDSPSCQVYQYKDQFRDPILIYDPGSLGPNSGLTLDFYDIERDELIFEKGFGDACGYSRQVFGLNVVTKKVRSIAEASGNQCGCDEVADADVEEKKQCLADEKKFNEDLAFIEHRYGPRLKDVCGSTMIYLVSKSGVSFSTDAKVYDDSLYLGCTSQDELVFVRKK